MPSAVVSNQRSDSPLARTTRNPDPHDDESKLTASFVSKLQAVSSASGARREFEESEHTLSDPRPRPTVFDVSAGTRAAGTKCLRQPAKTTRCGADQIGASTDAEDGSELTRKLRSVSGESLLLVADVAFEKWHRDAAQDNGLIQFDITLPGF